jgi:hypothetical protein
MKPTNNIYSKGMRLQSVFMMLLLLLLTVSPALLVATTHTHEDSCTISCSDAGNPYNSASSSPVEESKESKSQNNPSVSEEFLHEHPHADNSAGNDKKSHKHEHTRIYIAYHGELPVPPPRQS